MISKKISDLSKKYFFEEVIIYKSFFYNLVNRD